MTTRQLDAAESPIDVLVVGAGPTGLTLGCELLRRGVSCKLIERRDASSTLSRAWGIQPRTLEIFDFVGAGSRVNEAIERSRSGIVPGRTRSAVVAYFFRGRRTIVSWPAAATGATVDPRTLRRGGWLPQSEVEKILAQHFVELGGEISWEAEFTNMRQANGSVVCEMKDGTAVQCSWLVGCDGGRSAVRRAAGISLNGPDTGYDLILGDVELDFDHVLEPNRWPAGPILTWFAHDGVVSAASNPLRDEWRIMGTIKRPASATTVTETTLDLLQRMMDDRLPFRPPRITGASWLSSWAISERLAHTYRSDRVFIAGDAAHVHSPIGGQGLNMGVADAFNLGWKLASVCHGYASEDLLDTYEAERRPAAAAVLRWVARATRILVGNTGVDRLARDYVVVPAYRSATMRRRTLLLASQIRVNYRQSRLSRSAGKFPRQTIRPGDRLPNARCVIGGQSANLLDVMACVGWQLFLLPRTSSNVSSPSTLRDVVGRLADELGSHGVCHLVVDGLQAAGEWSSSVILDADHDVHAAFGIDQPAAFLVRPDGYVALRSPYPPPPGTIRDYLESVVGRAASVSVAEAGSPE